MTLKPTKLKLHLLLAFSLFFQSSTVFAHGGVVLENDVCLININFLQAHFTVFQPESSQDDEFCEDIPDLTRSVFVMEYLHDLLQDMRVDFRIIRDETNIGKYAQWNDVQQLGDIEALTVFYEPPRIEESGFFSASYNFADKGTYIGIVTASHPTEVRDYSAVFYFQVGGADLGSLPVFAVLLLLIQLGYWYSYGGYKDFRARRR